MTRFNKQHFLGLIFAALLGVGLIAPFTFLTIEADIEQVTPVAPKVIPKVVKKVEQPLHDVTLPNFAKIRDVKEKKRQFFFYKTCGIG